MLIIAPSVPQMLIIAPPVPLALSVLLLCGPVASAADPAKEIFDAQIAGNSQRMLDEASRRQKLP
jgi:hypothetical protein